MRHVLKKYGYMLLILAAFTVIVTGCGKNRKSAEEAVNISSQQDESDENEMNSENKPDIKDEGDVQKHEDDEYSDFIDTQKVVVIDPGHQKYGINRLEPIGPGATEKKAMLTSGTEGVVTKIPEYQLTLDVSLKLRDALSERGYKVVMIRENNDCPVSNKGRAEIANKYYNSENKSGTIFLRIHANSTSDSSANGFLTMCAADDNPYTPETVKDSDLLAYSISKNMGKETGARNRGVIKTNNMSGINWSKVPTVIVEMGFMSNPDEDRKMSTDEYQNRIVNGIADGVSEYYTNIKK